MTYLDKMTPGQQGRVVFVSGDSPITRRLTELGLVPGRTVKYLRNAPMRDPLEIQIGSSFLSLRHSEASLVAVEVEEK
jgi:ferrous iron transport protein A